MQNIYPIINVLIRTSNRPQHFKNCLKSVQEQQYPVRIIVSADNHETATYVRGNGVRPVMVDKPTDKLEAPYNLYLNKLISCVRDGWILIVDDDDRVIPGALLRLSAFLHDKASLVLTQMKWPNGRMIPELDYLGKEPVRKHIGMPCFLIHSRNKHLLQFDGGLAGDYRAALQLFKAIPKKIIAPIAIVEVGNFGNFGTPNDIK